MVENVLFRGGTVNNLFDAKELPKVACVLNLRTGADIEFSGIQQLHVPAANSVEIYQTVNGLVRKWANQVLFSILQPNTFPILIHCTAGRDRTGVIIALILLALGMSREIVIEEYLQSEGVQDKEDIVCAIAGIDQPGNYIVDDHSIITFLASRLLA